MEDNKVEHQVERNRFVIPVGDVQAVLDYQLLKSGEDSSGRETSGEGNAVTGVDFTYTYVPPELRGQGLAEKLVRRGLQWAREQEFEIKASCWYVAKFLR